VVFITLRRNFILTNAAPTFSGVTTTSEVLGDVTVSGYDFALSSSAATDLGALMEIRLATSGEAETGNKGETFRGLRALESISGTQWFAHTDPTLTVLTAAKIQIYSNKCGLASPWGPDKVWGNDGSMTAAVLIGPAQTSVNTNDGTNNLGDFESTSAIPEINIALIAGHDMLFLGEKGQAKSRLMRTLVRFLDEEVPYLDLAGAPLREDPYQPISRLARDFVSDHSDDQIPIAWWPRGAQFTIAA